MPVLGPGELLIGETGAEIDVSCLVNNAILSASPSTSDPTTKLCGTQKQGTTTYSATLSGNIDIDPDVSESLFCLSWEMPGSEQPFKFTPDSADGTYAEGTLVLQPLDFGSTGDYGSDLTADFEFQVLWKPTISCSGGGGTVPATGATAGTPGTWSPGGATPPADAAGATSASVTASPTTAWTVGQFVQGSTSGTAGEMHWSGTAWVAGKA
jgi:hypothetical protein